MTTETCNQLDTFLIDGKPLGECTTAEALAWAAREKRRVLDVLAWVASVERQGMATRTLEPDGNAQQPMPA